MMKSDVQKAKTKHQCIMCLTRKVAIGQKGMGLKIMKFHGILHVADAVLDFSVPLECNTGCNESHHIATKKNSMLTQKDLTTVEEQTAERMPEMEALALAQIEIGGKWLCDCGLGHDDDVPDLVLHHKTRNLLGGAVHHTEKNGQTGQLLMRSDRVEKGKSKCPMVENGLLEFVDGLQARVSLCIPIVTLHSCDNRDGNIFWADLSHCKNVWRDWVVVNWFRDGQSPNRIYGFVDSTEGCCCLPI